MFLSQKFFVLLFVGLFWPRSSLCVCSSGFLFYSRFVGSFLVLSKLKFVIPTLSLREGINVVRLFLGDIILEILFDIIFVSVFLYGYIWACTSTK